MAKWNPKTASSRQALQTVTQAAIVEVASILEQKLEQNILIHYNMCTFKDYFLASLFYKY